MKFKLVADSSCNVISMANPNFGTVPMKVRTDREYIDDANLDLAAGLFAGKVSTINEMCKGTIYLRGMISMLDNVNRILDRVSVYLG